MAVQRRVKMQDLIEQLLKTALEGKQLANIDTVIALLRDLEARCRRLSQTDVLNGKSPLVNVNSQASRAKIKARKLAEALHLPDFEWVQRRN